MSAAPGPAVYDRWAEYYDLTDGDRSPHLRFYRSLLRPGDRAVLELGCGTGVVAAELAACIAASGETPRVAGVDISEGMLGIARARFPGIEWRQGDMRAPPVEGPFDLVFCCYHTFQFLTGDDDLARAFASARELIAPDGRFAFDLYQPNLPYLRVARTDTVARSVSHAGRELQIREDAHYDEAARILGLEWRLVDADAPAEVLAAAHFRIRQHFPEDVLRLLRASGWRVVDRHGDLEGGPFDASAKRQVLVCAPD